ncbi:MAG: hypothetical protein HY821_13255, partial [Acidobacteria bacterium]|nr:hypothetical protein [Acidobacteriota bacterium]
MRLSFRDPDGFVFREQGRILRCIYPEAATGFHNFFASDFRRKLLDAGRICPSWILAEQEARQFAAGLPVGSVLVEHQPISFPNFPWEWSPHMLYAAGESTLELAEGALLNGFLLKDATPNNLIFEGAHPVFIDELSFSQTDHPETVWRPCGQFVSTFLYPLLAATRFGMRLDEIFTVSREGLDTARLWQMTPAWRLFLPPFLELVTLPRLASAAGTADSADGYRKRPT